MSHADTLSPPADVLVVDDEETVALTLGEILSAEGYRVEQSTTVDDALAKIERRGGFQTRPYDAAVLDLNIGSESGLTILSHLHERSPYTAVLILTGFGSLDTAVQALRQGAVDYLVKPCDVTELKDSLARGIGQLRRRQLDAQSVEAQHSLEQALAHAERAREDFLTIAGHELKTPLAAVIGWAQIAQRQLARGVSEGAVERLEAVVQQAQRMARMVESFTNLVSLRRGTRRPPLTMLDLRPAVTRVIDETRRRALRREFQIELPAQPVLARADPAAMDTVLRNLLDNAVKFSPAGGTVTVRLSATDGEAWISVRDEGIGLTAEEIPHIFDRFYQADGDAMTRRFGGIGAGLYLAHELVEAQGGRIWAESPGRDQGSTFTVALATE
jgi:signal transduction histidine kinase